MKKGISGLIDPPRIDDPKRQARAREKQERLIKLIHQSPKIYDINRTSWKQADLALVYEKLYGVYISSSTVGNLLNKGGYGFTKSRELLTSPDPNFREKLDNIKRILANLTPDEKFFSVDEFGHFSVKIKGGWFYNKNRGRKIIPQLQKSKGFLIITAALELSTNQVTHFYSGNKNTDEMIKLINILLLQYHTSKKLYISWDKASWHISKKLTEWIKEINKGNDNIPRELPLVELAPLPASAQFLNVIESVFSGLAKSIIHNSDYQSLEECQMAIDRYFSERNEHFLRHPRRAGNKIWGRELVRAEFNEVNNCKVPPFKVKKVY